ncbi:hypothetical protein FRC09_019794 [Ceratobasidium sp. 395]|nr:hypothetical protein FRC09_019794 [Ceratobasidium sp. 395]
MLKRLKRTSDRAEQAIRYIFESPIPKPPKIKLRYTRWRSMKALVALLNQDSGLFKPLASTQLRTKPEYAQLGMDLDNLCLHVANYISPEQPLSVSSESIANFTRGLDLEARALPNEEGGGNLGEFEEAAAAIGVHTALRVFSRIRKLLALFVMSENTSLWEMVVDEIEATELVAPLHAPEAHYRYAGLSAVPRNGCMQNTRVAVLQDLQDWVHYGRSKNILWLNGTAGTGKTTVMYSLCEYLESSGRISASFFCSRKHRSCRDVNWIVPSISYQLARQSRPYRCALSRVLGQDPVVFGRSIDEQLRMMIFVPLQAVAHTFNADPVIVIDGLDQCDDLDVTKCALDAILRHLIDLPVRVIVASRPIPAIRSRIRSYQSKRRLPLEQRLHEQDQTVVQNDIRTYLTVRLKHLALSTDDLERLLRRVGVLFFFAAIVVSHISNSDDASNGAERLNELLDLASSSGGVQSKDIAYNSILEQVLGVAGSVTAESGEIGMILSTLVSAQERLSLNAIAGLLGLDLVHVVGDLLRCLLPVLRVSPADSRSIYIDESFVEHLSSSPRTDELLPDEDNRNIQLTHACFKVISLVDPPFNICNLESSYLEDTEVSNLSERVDEAIPPELLYACRRWAGHMALAPGRSDDIVGDLEAFLSTRLLLWMEILNLKRCTSEGVEILSSTRVWAQREMLSDGLQKLMEDNHQFIESFASRAISNSTPHIYVSQLQFWPQHSEISQCYRHRLKVLVNMSHTDGHAESISSVCYSPDGAYIASGAWDDTIRIWDAHTGKPVRQPLTCHTGHVNSVAYSPDGAYIASGSDDQTIRIWDAHTGKPVGQPLTGHADSVRSVAYSPDGAYIASNSYKTIQTWDAHTGKPVNRGRIFGHTDSVYSVAYSPDGARIASGSGDNNILISGDRSRYPESKPLKGHTNRVSSVTYSPDGAYIASGSWDKTIRIWNARTGKSIGQPLTGHALWVHSVAYSPDGAYIASGSFDNTIRIWDARTGKPVGQPLTGHTDWVRSVAYSPDGAYIVSGSRDNTIRIWVAPKRPEPKPVQPSIHWLTKELQHVTAPVCSHRRSPTGADKPWLEY